MGNLLVKKKHSGGVVVKGNFRGKGIKSRKFG